MERNHRNRDTAETNAERKASAVKTETDEDEIQSRRETKPRNNGPRHIARPLHPQYRANSIFNKILSHAQHLKMPGNYLLFRNREISRRYRAFSSILRSGWDFIRFPKIRLRGGVFTPHPPTPSPILSRNSAPIRKIPAAENPPRGPHFVFTVLPWRVIPSLIRLSRRANPFCALISGSKWRPPKPLRRAIRC